MSDSVKPLSLGSSIVKVRKSWYFFIILGACLIVAGGFAATHLLAATIASILYVGAAMIVAAVLSFVHAVTMGGWQNRVLNLVSGLVYGLTGVLIVLNPALASLSLTLLTGVLLCISGGFRVAVGFRERHVAGGGWIIAAGIFTIATGLLVLISSIGISLWFLGALLAVDLLMQGFGFLAFGFAVRPRHRRIPAPASAPVAN